MKGIVISSIEQKWEKKMQNKGENKVKEKERNQIIGF